jgi:Mg2+-importing ATPase
LLLTATVVVGVLAISLPYLSPVARTFGFAPLPLSLLLASALIVLLYVIATEVTKLWFYGRLIRDRGAGAREQTPWLWPPF